jgi:serine/threonine protein kinase
MIVGTPAFMAPEQIRGAWRDLGPWTDLYSVGCTAFTLAAGEPPVGSEATRSLQEIALGHVHGEAPPLQAAVAVPAGFEAWVRRLLRKEPQDRYRRAADAAEALLALEAPGEAGERPSFAATVPLDRRRPLDREGGARGRPPRPRRWLRGRFSAERNPGDFPSVAEVRRDSSYYYWAWSGAHAMRALGGIFFA